MTLLEEELGPKARVDWARVEGLLRRVGGMVGVVVVSWDFGGRGWWMG